MKYRACTKCAQSVGIVNVVGNILMIVIKGYMGVIGGSKGLIADAIHSCADLLATIVMIIGLTISGRERDEKHPYGYGKAEHIVAVIIYLFLLVVAGYILFDGARAIIEGRRVIPCMIAIWGAVFSIGINELMFRQSVCAGTQVNSPSIVAKAWESRSDVYSSVAVVIGIMGAKMGFYFMDPLAAILVGVIIFKVCIEMMKEAILNLIDKTPDELSIPDLHVRLWEKIKDLVIDINTIRVREVGGEYEFDIEVDVPDSLTVFDGEGIKDKIRRFVCSMMEKKSTVEVRLRPREA
ncbi:MAG: cation diffusion facilitator family transporter [Thermodesulfobacteriota bacterium]